MNRWVTWCKENPDADPNAWINTPMLPNPAKFNMTEEEMNERYADIHLFLTNVKQDALPILTAMDPEWLEYFHIHAKDDPNNALGLLIEALVLLHLDVGEPSAITKKAWERVCYDAVILKSGESEPKPLEGDPPLEDVLEAVTAIDMDDSDRMRLLRMFRETEMRAEELRVMFTALTEIVNAHYDKLEERHCRLRECMEKDPASLTNWLEQLLVPGTEKQPHPLVHVTIVAIDFNRFEVRVRQESEPRIFIGNLFLELSDALQDEVRDTHWIQTRLKALADPTRWEMLKRTAEQEQYVQQLADALDLKPATVSHHLAYLHGAMLVTVRVEGRRSYVRINEKGIRELMESIEALLPKKEG